MGRAFFLVVIAFFLSLLVWGGFLYLEQYQGIGPAVLPPPKDITEIIREEQNTTDFLLVLPEGFSISIFAKNVGPARVMAWDPLGILLVSITKDGKVLALPDENKDGVADRVETVIEGLNRPHGLLFFEGKLYIAESDQVASYEYNQQTLRASHKEKLVDLPNAGHHSTRTIAHTNFGSENRLLISVGSTCNACVESDWRRAAILSSNMDGSDLKAFATGLRNAVFMATHPVTEEVWVTEMGRDLLGDDVPPDEINIVQNPSTLRDASGQASSGQNSVPNFGWPTCYGKNIHDTQFDPSTLLRAGKNTSCDSFMPSYIDIQAHSAPLGLAFVPSGWPKEYQNDLLVAYHGSWNRKEPTGYKIVRFRLDEQGNYLGQEDFIAGWLQGGRALGRPVDILSREDGVMYISDDHAGVIYRVAYKEGVAL